ncbi:MAG: hypothetical protein FWG88_02200 [Oscillospiraceae bacterium]|nr:hypothetical protein [Oscillospiraceae bacterium]
MSKVIVRAGVCGFTTEINVESEDSMTAKVSISSQCPAYAHFDGEPIELDAYECCFGKVGEGGVYELLSETCLHAACPVPSAVLKAVEVACGLALPADVSMTIEK